jgi:hypothetical protein
MAEYNWLEIRMQYINGQCNEKGQRVYPSLADLSKQTGISLSTLAHKAAREEWNKQRRQSEERIMMAAIAQYEDEMSAKLAHVDKLASDAAVAMLQVIVESLEQAETKQERQALTTKYSKVLPDLLSTAHTAIGVEQMIEHQEHEVHNEDKQYSPTSAR